MLALYDAASHFIPSSTPSGDSGVMFEIVREDGYPFQAESLDIRYHNQAIESLWSRKRYR